MLKALKKSPKALILIIPLVLNGGPGGIRTHDQRIMSPLRYRCATGPNIVRWRLRYSIVMPVSCVSVATFLSKNLTFSQLFLGRVPQALIKMNDILIFNCHATLSNVSSTYKKINC